MKKHGNERGGKMMNINDFQADDKKTKEDMKRKLKDYKLEKVLSLWYFVIAKSKAAIVGSKN